MGDVSTILTSLLEWAIVFLWFSAHTIIYLWGFLIASRIDHFRVCYRLFPCQISTGSRSGRGLRHPHFGYGIGANLTSNGYSAQIRESVGNGPAPHRRNFPTIG